MKFDLRQFECSLVLRWLVPASSFLKKSVARRNGISLVDSEITKAEFGNPPSFHSFKFNVLAYRNIKISIVTQ